MHLRCRWKTIVGVGGFSIGVGVLSYVLFFYFCYHYNVLCTHSPSIVFHQVKIIITICLWGKLECLGRKAPSPIG